MKHKVIISKSVSSVNRELDDGWLVISVTAQHITGKGDSSFTEDGKLCFVLQKEE